MESQIKRRLKEIDMELTSQLTEFPSFLSSSSVSLPMEPDTDILKSSLDSVFKSSSSLPHSAHPNLHLISEIEAKTKAVLGWVLSLSSGKNPVEGGNSSPHSSSYFVDMVKAIQNDMRKKIQIEQMLRLAEYIRTLKELEGLMDSQEFLDKLDLIGREGAEEIETQLEEMKMGEFKKIKEIEQQEGEIIRLANVVSTHGLENKCLWVLHKKVQERVEQKYQYLKTSYDAKRVKISDAWIALIKFAMEEFNITCSKVLKMFSLEAWIKFKAYLINSLTEYESSILDDYKLENKIEQMTIFSNSDSIAEEKLK